jgi:hypothetical protein
MREIAPAPSALWPRSSRTRGRGLPLPQVHLAGSLSPAVFLLCALLLLPIVLCFVHLSQLSAETGGPVACVRPAVLVTITVILLVCNFGVHARLCAYSDF